MKVVSPVVALLSVVLSIPSIDINPEDEINRNIPKLSTNEVYGPFDGSEDVTARFYLVGGDTFRFNISFTFSYNETHAIYSTSTYSLSALFNGKNYFDYVLPIKNRMRLNGITIDVSLEGTLNNGSDSFSIVLYPTTTETIYSYNYRNNTYSIQNRVFKITRNKVYSKEQVNFKDTIDYITNSRVNALEIDEISFKYTSNFSLRNLSANHYISFEDEKEIFPNISTSSDKANFPIKIKQTNSDISLSYNFNYYFDDKTYIMYESNPSSLGIKAKEVDRVYAGDKYLKDLELVDINIILNNVLLSGTTIIIPIQFLKDKNRVGYCNNSNNCIVGGIRE